jgi:monoamine oxidase
VQFGYYAEGGAEFVHGEAPVTRSLLREARLSLLPIKGKRWTVNDGSFSRGSSNAHEAQLHQALQQLKVDLPVAEFLNRNFAGPEYGRLRHSIERMVEGYDAADPSRASTLALREEWMNVGRAKQARIVGGYGALIDFLAGECQKQGSLIYLGTEISAVETADQHILVRCSNGATYQADAVVLTVSLPILQGIVLPVEARRKAAAAAHIGFGNVIKILLRFETHWWTENDRRGPSDLTFLFSDAQIPVWWTQYPAEHPVLTGWFGGPKTQALAHLTQDKLIGTGLASLAEIFAVSSDYLRRMLATAWATNWANDPFARGAYSYATPETREAQMKLVGSGYGPVLFSGEAVYRGPEMGTVEAALASGLSSAGTILAG